MTEKYPKILKREIAAKSRLFTVEQLHLQFANGNERIFERIVSPVPGAVLVVPFLDEETILLVSEYCAGTDDYQLGFPKGTVDQGEAYLEAANRELMEETGYGARELRILKHTTAVPGYWDSSAAIVMAKDLYPQQLEGDEPEPLQVIPWKISDYRSLLHRQDFTEARSIAALLLIKDLAAE